MTDAQIEQIARAYCRKMGLDPDQRGLWSQLWSGPRPMWEAAVREVCEAIAMREAIDEVLGEKGAGG